MARTKMRSSGGKSLAPRLAPRKEMPTTATSAESSSNSMTNETPGTTIQPDKQCTCGQPNNTNMIVCSNGECSRLVHMDCVHLDPELECHKNLQDFYCVDCARPIKGEGCFEVEEIIGWRRQDGSQAREFLVKWKGYELNLDEDGDGWVRESDMSGCVPMLRKWLAEKRLPQTTRTYLMGSSDGIAEDCSNFVDSDQFIKTLRGYIKSVTYSTGIQVDFYEDEEDGIGRQDKIWIVVTMDHCFVVCVQDSGRNIYLADGTNLYKRSDIHRHALAPIFGEREPTVLDYNYQINEDHCATSGACITLDFCKRHRTKNWKGEIIVKSSLYNEIAAIFHKKTWVRLGARQQVQQGPPKSREAEVRDSKLVGAFHPLAEGKKRLIWVSCDLCGEYRALCNNQRKMTLHRLHCKGKINV